MNEPNPSAVPFFFCYIANKEKGPFDLIELAGELRYQNIDDNTHIRRKDHEEWCALHELPEYTSLQNIPIEAIARHLHEKEQIPGSVPSFAHSPSLLKSLWPWAAGLAVILGLIGYALKPDSPVSADLPAPPPPATTTADTKPAPPPAPFSDPWVETQNDVFSVNCPAELKLQWQTGSRDTISYPATVDKVTFGVDTMHLPEYSSGEYDQIIESVKDNFFYEKQFRIISERNVTGKGYQGIEIGCVIPPDPRTEYCRMRLIYGKGNLILVWVTADPADFGPANRDKFIASVKMW